MDDRVCETKSAATERINLPKIAGLRFLQGALIGLGRFYPEYPAESCALYSAFTRPSWNCFLIRSGIKKTVLFSPLF